MAMMVESVGSDQAAREMRKHVAWYGEEIVYQHDSLALAQLIDPAILGLVHCHVERKRVRSQCGKADKYQCKQSWLHSSSLAPTEGGLNGIGVQEFVKRKTEVRDRRLSTTPQK